VAEHQLLPNKYINYMSYLLVNPDMTFAIKAFKSLCEGDLFFNCVVQISYRASFCTLARSSTRESYLTSIQHVISLFSTKLLVDKTALYGSITVSETFGDGKTENVASIRSGYSSLIFASSNDPRPDPVPPPIADSSAHYSLVSEGLTM
jgi:hypothetical protein